MKKRVTRYSLWIPLLLMLAFVPTPEQAHASTALYGIALSEPTTVYSAESRESPGFKTYEAGRVLKFTAYNDEWYEAVVKVGGKWETGYIDTTDVEVGSSDPTTVYGIAKGVTPIYQQASKGAKVWKSYQKGSVLKYETFTEDWYKAVVYVGGVKKTGYIHHTDVTTGDMTPVTLRGVAKKTVPVYRDAKGEASWKSYGPGTILKYETFTADWYKAVVYINGVKKTGYIQTKEVENAQSASERETLRGIGVADRVYVYQKAATNAPSWKSYSKGSILKYETFTSEWYIAVVYVGGEKKTGYIYRSEVEEFLPPENRQQETAISLKNATSIYETPSEKGNVLERVPKNRVLELETFASKWYITTTTDGSVGYVFHGDVHLGNVKETVYNVDFQSFLDTQMTRSPQTSSGGGFENASREQVTYYSNPKHFLESDASFYQFLLLSTPSGLNVTDLNEKILKGKGILEGKGAAFIEAAERHALNEAYLISHARLETGHGTSKLANGIRVGKDAKGILHLVTSANEGSLQEIKATYNMYGIGAVDSCPDTCGAKTAYENGWFTPESAIIGGAGFVKQEYVYNAYEQNTIYKMRWNPLSWKQYATDIGWAVKQANLMKQIYDTVDHGPLVFDVTVFRNHNHEGGNTSYEENLPTGIIGKMNVSVSGVPKGAEVAVLGSRKNGTYYIEYSGKKSWVSASSLSISNLIQTKVALNVRDSATWSAPSKGVLAKGEQIAGVLDKDGNLVKQGTWYKVKFQGTEAFISGETSYIELVQ